MTRIGRRWIALTFLFLAPEGLAMPQRDAVEAVDPGVTPGTGQARVVIPIDTPPAAGGFAPKLALTYGSLGGDGAFGLGWSLGLGAIERSVRFGAPSFDDALDVFELDGARLVPSSTEADRYHVFVEDFSRIRVSRSGGVITSWEVTSPQGVTARYGSSSDSRVVEPSSGATTAWLLAELEDPSGNAIVFEYDRQDVGVAVPKTVRYTLRGGAAVGAERRIEFVLEPRPDPVARTRASVHGVLTRRVSELRTTIGGAPFRRRMLSYSAGRSRLSSSQLFGADCAVAESDPAGNPACTALPAEHYDYLRVDDVVAPGVSTRWNPSAWTSPIAFEKSAHDPRDQALGVRVADVDGDGRPDLVRAFEVDGGAPIHEVYLNDGAGFVLDAGPASFSEALASIAIAQPALRVVRAGADIVDVALEPAIPLPLYFDSARDWHDPVAPDVYRAPLRAQLLDVNGDGRADLVASLRVGAAALDCSAQDQCPTLRAGMRIAEVWLNDGSAWVRDPVLSSTLPPLESVFLYERHGPLGLMEAGGLDHAVVRSAGGQDWARLARYPAGARFGELDGDGWIDLVARHDDHSAGASATLPLGTGLEIGAWRGSASGFVPAPAYMPPVAIEVLHRFAISDPAHDSGFVGDGGVRLVDLNADGLADLVKTAIGGEGAAALTLPTFGSPELADEDVWLNDGTGFCAASDGCAQAVAYRLPASLNRESLAPRGLIPGLTSIDAGVRFGDLDGDGLPDLLRADATLTGGMAAWIQTPDTGPLPASGARWVADSRFTPPISLLETGVTYRDARTRGVRVADLDGDGGIDFLRAPDAQREAQASLELHADRLISWENGQGGRLSFAYASLIVQRDTLLEGVASAHAAAWAELDDDAVPLWQPLPVVTQTTLEGIGNGPYTTTHRYALPLWCAHERSFLGLRLVEETRDDGSVLERLHFQRHGRAGRLARSETRGNRQGGALVESRDEYWEVVDGGTVTGSDAGILVGRLRYRTARTHAAGGDGASHALGVDYDDDAGFNFATRIDVSRPSGGVEIEREAAPLDLDAWIGGLPAVEIVRDGGELLREAHLGYAAGTTLVPLRVRTIATRGPNPVPGPPSVESWSYDGFGNLRQSVDAEGAATWFCYDGDADLGPGACPAASGTSSHSVRVGLRDPLGGVTELIHAPGTEVVAEAVSYNGDRAIVERDALARPTKLWAQPFAEAATLLETRQHFPGIANAAGQPYIEQWIETGSGPPIRTAAYHDGIGRTVRTVRDGPGGGTIGQATRSDHAGRVVLETRDIACADPHCSGLSGDETRAEAVAYDALGRWVRRETPDGISVARYGGVLRSLPVGPGGSARLGVVLQKDAAGNLRQSVHDGARTLWSEICANSVSPLVEDLEAVTCSVAESTLTTWTAAGEMSRIFDAEAVATGDYASASLRHRFEFEYDTLGRRVVARDPDGGESVTAYDRVGNVVGLTNARGQSTALTYDLLRRLATVDRPSAEEDLTILYDDSRGPDGSWTRRRQTVTGDAGFEARYAYDAMGRMGQRAETALGVTLVMDFRYDLLDRPTWIAYPQKGVRVGYEYDGAYLSRVCQATQAGTCETLEFVSAIDYDAVGRPAALHTPAGVTEWDYDPERDRLGALRFHSSQGVDALDLGFAYDPNGRRTQIDDFRPDKSDGVDHASTYAYDTQGRISAWTHAGLSRYFRYDSIGNLIGRDLASPSGQNQFYDHPDKPHALTFTSAGGSYAYDADGNLVARGSHAQHLVFDSERRVACVGSGPGGCDVAAFQYDVDGIRVADVTSAGMRRRMGDWFSWDPATRNGTIHVYALGARVATRHSGGGSLRAAPHPALRGLPSPPAWLGALGLIVAAAGLSIVAWRSGALVFVARRPLAAGLGWLCVVLLLPNPAVAKGPQVSFANRWIVADPLGSGLLVVDASGSVLHRRHFEPFGRIAAQTSAPSESSARHFGGHDFHEQSGLYDFEQRWYDPEIGRFLSVDPVLGEPGDPAVLDGYSLARNDPVNRVDPDGRYAPGDLQFAVSVGSFAIHLALALSALAWTEEMARDLVGLLKAVAVYAESAARYWASVERALARAAQRATEPLRESRRSAPAEGARTRAVLVLASRSIGEFVRGVLSIFGGSRGRATGERRAEDAFANLGLVLQDLLVAGAQNAQVRDAQRQIREIQQRNTGRRGVDVYAGILVQGQTLPHPTELFGEIIIPRKLTVSELAVPSGQSPPPAVIPRGEVGDFIIFRRIQVVADGIPIDPVRITR